MASKISGVEGTPIASIGAGRAVARPADATSAESQPPDSDSESVQITGTARTLARLEQTLGELPIVNETRVSAIRTAIEQGMYAIRPQHIADQLLSLERSLQSIPEQSDQSDASGDPAHPGQ